MTKWTESQEKAIKSKGSVLISASAGTGKTAVLTEKVAHAILEEKIDIDRMLIVTFSNNAANEMRERIRNKIYEIAVDKKYDRGTRNRMWNQLRLMGNSHIQTIHAFCNEVIRNNFDALDISIDPNVSIADNYDVGIMKMNSAKNVLETQYAAPDAEFKALEAMISDSEPIEQVIIHFYDTISSYEHAWDWMEKAIEAYDTDRLPDFAIQMILNDLEEAMAGYDHAIGMIDSSTTQMAKISETFYADYKMLEEAKRQVSANDFEGFSETLSNFGATVRFPSSKDGDYDEIKDARNNARDLIVGKYKKVAFDEKMQVNRIKAMYPLLKKLQEIIVAFDAEYSSQKRERNLIDFNDMEKFAHAILEKRAPVYRDMFYRIFVDEYQDTNGIQESIINMISKQNNLFCVGDLKQSIYRFRSSDPLLFLQRKNLYSADSKQGNVISLSSNFRSAQNIIDCANDTFSNIARVSEEISYDEGDMLIKGREHEDETVPVEVVLVPDELAELAGVSNDEAEIYNMVNIIKNNIGTDIYDLKTGEVRKAEYGDIAILCRKLSGVTDSIARIFSANNIPFVIEKSGELLETMEVRILMNLMNLICNPDDDVRLISIMHLGLFGFTDEDIVKLKGGYYNNMLAEIKKGTRLGAKCADMLTFFESCKGKQKYMSLTSVAEYIISETTLLDYFAVMENAKQRIANIKEIQTHIRNYEKKNNGKIYGFCAYISDIIQSGTSMPEAKIGYGDNSVRITTIHKSKGLEYPIVIMGFCAKKFNQQDKRSNILADRDAGIGIRYYDHKNRIKGKNLFRTYVEAMSDKKGIEEEMRLLYVAMTRAREKLYIQGVANEAIGNLQNAKSFLDWVLSTMGEKSTCSRKGSWNISMPVFQDIFAKQETAPTVSNLDFVKETTYVATGEKEETEITEFVPLTLSASNKLKKTEVEQFSFAEPNFLGNDAKRIGTANHNFLKYLDFKKCVDEKGIEEEFERIAPMMKEEAKYVSLNKMKDFFCSSIGQFITSCDEYMKEKHVNIIKKSKEMDYQQEKDILVRCIIDLVCVKDGKYYLIDYKTDHVKNPENEEELKEKASVHTEQLNLYKEALETVYGIQIETAYVAFLNYGKACII